MFQDLGLRVRNLKHALLMSESKHCYVYILTNMSNHVLYVGVTNDIIRRMFEHKNKSDKPIES